MPFVEIIHLLPDQWQKYRQIRLEALQTEPQAFSTTYQDMIDKPDTFWQGRLAASAAGKDNWLLFAKVGERITGMMGAFTLDEIDKATIISVYVTPDFRGKGISNALMGAILSELRQNESIHIVELAVVKSQKAAIQLYRNFGFEVAAENEIQMGDGRMKTEITMHRKL